MPPHVCQSRRRFLKLTSTSVALIPLFTLPARAADLVKLEESDPTAVALGYRHSVADVDAAAYPRYVEGQNCAHCHLYVADAGATEGWGGCSIFPGKLVQADGWCNAYIAPPAS